MRKNITVFVTLAAILLAGSCLLTGCKSALVQSDKKGEDSSIAEDARTAFPNRVSIYYPGEEGYPPYESSWDGPEIIPKQVYGENILTTSGEIVPNIMDADIMMSNSRYIVIYDSKDGSVKGESYISGPNIVINGYAVPPGDFYARRGVWYTGYSITPAALRAAGLVQMEDGSSATEFERVMGLPEENYGVTGLCEVEQDVTFDLLEYDAETNTYYFSAEQNGPFSGISNYFYYLTQKSGDVPQKLFPTKYMTELKYGCVIDDVCGCRVPFGYANSYWKDYGLSRNECRERLNEECGTHYPPLEYDGDPRYEDVDSYIYAAVAPGQYAARKATNDAQAQYYAEHPEQLEVWKIRHPGWDEKHIPWDTAITIPEGETWETWEYGAKWDEAHPD